MRSLEGQTPTRITKIPYIVEKHGEVDARVYDRESIGSFSNCLSCHTTADKGINDDDDATIPK